jgi:hypothetical protein
MVEESERRSWKYDEMLCLTANETETLHSPSVVTSLKTKERICGGVSG